MQIHKQKQKQLQLQVQPPTTVNIKLLSDLEFSELFE